MRWWKFANEAATGWVGVLILFFIQFTWWLASPFDRIPIWVLHVVVFLAFSAILVIYGILRSILDSKALAENIAVKQYVALGKDIILIVDRNTSLSYGRVVSVYISSCDGSAEALCGWGFVQSETSAGYAQIKIVDVYEDLIRTAALYARTVRPSNLIIKPYILKELLVY